MQLTKFFLAPVLAMSMALPALSSDQFGQDDSVVQVNPCAVLPPDIMALILSKNYFANAKDVMPTCRGFRQAVQARGHVKISSFGEMLLFWKQQDEILDFLLSLAKVEWLDFGGSLNVFTRMQDSNQNFGDPSLTGKDSFRGKVTFAEILKKNLSFKHLSFGHIDLDDQLVEQFASLKQLRFLDAQRVGGVSNGFVEGVLRNCPEMHTLKFRCDGGSSIKKRDLPGILIQHGQALQELDIQWSGLPLSVLLSAVNQMPRLRRFVTNSNAPRRKNSDEAFFELTFEGEDVERRTVPRHMTWTDEKGINAAVEDGFSYETICLLARNCPPLKSLALFEDHYTNEEVRRIGSLCPRLEHLRIGGTAPELDSLYDEVRVDTVEVLEHLPMLESLVLCGDHLSFDGAFWDLVRRKTRTLDISEGSYAGTFGATQVLEAANIKKLVLSRVNGLTKPEVEWLQAEFPDKEIVVKGELLIVANGELLNY